MPIGRGGRNPGFPIDPLPGAPLEPTPEEVIEALEKYSDPPGGCFIGSPGCKTAKPVPPTFPGLGPSPSSSSCRSAFEDCVRQIPRIDCSYAHDPVLCQRFLDNAGQSCETSLDNCIRLAIPLLPPSLLPSECKKKPKWKCSTKARNWGKGTPCDGQIFVGSGMTESEAYTSSWQQCVDAGCHRPGKAGGDCGHVTCVRIP